MPIYFWLLIAAMIVGIGSTGIHSYLVNNYESSKFRWVTISVMILSVVFAVVIMFLGFSDKTKISKHVDVLQTIEFDEKIILILDDHTVLEKTDLIWKSNLDNIYKEVSINNFDVKTINYIIKEKKNEK